MINDLSTRRAPLWRDLMDEMSSKDVAVLEDLEQSGEADRHMLNDAALAHVWINRYNCGVSGRATATDLAIHLERVGRVKFRELWDFFEVCGITVSGRRALTGEHVGRPHVDAAAILVDSVSEQFVDAVSSLFQWWPVDLMIGDSADFSGAEEPWWLAWVGESSDLPAHLGHGPAVNPNVDSVADHAKYNYARGTQEIAAAHYCLAEMAGLSRISRDESMDLQRRLSRVWEALYSGTIAAVRDQSTSDRIWAMADNTYSNGQAVVSRVLATNGDDLDHRWEFDDCLLADGAVDEFPLTTSAQIEPPPPPDRPRIFPPSETEVFLRRPQRRRKGLSDRGLAIQQARLESYQND